jgi:hypothetical protein
MPKSQGKIRNWCADLDNRFFLQHQSAADGSKRNAKVGNNPQIRAFILVRNLKS